MAAECDFLDYRSGYYCRKKGDRVGSDTVNKYCKGWTSYKDCPIYCESSSSGGCYLTTACVDCKNLPDDCKELTVLRSFRDEYMAKQPNGSKEIREYYNKAPKIVKAINSDPNKRVTYEHIYLDVVGPCVKLIENGRNAEAYIKYKEMVRELEKQYM